MVNTPRNLIHAAERVFRDIFERFPGFRVQAQVVPKAIQAGNLQIRATSGSRTYSFGVEVKTRITPQTALAVCPRLRELPRGMIPVLFSTVISPRVAEIARQHGICFADGAGNCWLWNEKNHLLIERQGIPSQRQPQTAAADPFSPKSSRIVRAMLTRPSDGWQVRQLAGHADVQVSPGLVVKVKRALVEGGYAVEHQRLLYLRDPIGLLEAWTNKYPGPIEQIPMYFRGDPATVEETVGRWCRENGLRYALGGLSAAWRLAPEVRYSVAAIYVEDRGLDGTTMEELASKYGGKRVDTGPNLYLWRAFDRSVFASCDEAPKQLSVTSALQTYLDLKKSAGRGEDAAKAIFEKRLGPELRAAASREQERHSGTD